MGQNIFEILVNYNQTPNTSRMISGLQRFQVCNGLFELVKTLGRFFVESVQFSGCSISFILRQ
jgi:hypothetical protein